MKLLFIAPIVLLVFVNQVTSHCSSTITYYYDCKLYSIKQNSTGYHSYSFKNRSDDAFYNRTLGKIDSFSKAMNHFRSIFNEINTCKESWCDCARFYLLYGYNYTFFFNNSRFYPEMVSILNTIKTNYRVKNMDELDSSEVETNVYTISNFPFLSGFCYKYDYSYSMFSLNAETYEFSISSWDAMIDCAMSNLILTFAFYGENIHTLSTPIQNFTLAEKDQYYSCLSNYLPKTCPQDIKRAILLTELYSYPEVIRGSNLTAFIDSIGNKTTQLKKTTYIFHNHLLSIKKNYEECKFTKSDYVFFSSNWLKINGKPILFYLILLY